MVTEVSTKAPCKEPGNECEADDDENEEEADADNPGPRLGKYHITTANIIDINLLKNWHHSSRIFEGFHVFHIQTSNSYLTSRFKTFKTFDVTLYTSVNSCNVFYPNIRHM